MKRIPVLDGMRGLAILLVISAHTFSRPGPCLWLIPGFFGVTIFMVLSGFLITRVMLADEERSGRLRLGRFYQRRAWRILPALYTFLLTVAMLSHAGIINAVTPQSWWAGALYVRNLFGGEQQITEHLWSLGLEGQFYLVWPALFVSTRRFRFPFTICAVLATSVLRFIAMHGGASWIALGGGFQADHVLYFNSFVRMDTFLMGAIFAMHPAKWTKSVPPVLIAGVALWPLPSWGTVWCIPVISFLIAILICSLIENPRGFESKLLSSKILGGLGTVSYSIYLWQQLFLVQNGVEALHWWSLPALAAVSAASYWLIERPALRMKDRDHIGDQLHGRDGRNRGLLRNPSDPDGRVALT